MNALCCPLCRLPLSNSLDGLVCANKHQFDRAKEGYFNLLPVQFKRSLEPGDAKLQLTARRSFLQAGFYANLAQELGGMLPKSTRELLDLGCGEGYFTAAMADRLPDTQVYGIDIAKAGVRMAARTEQKTARPRPSIYAVASSFDVPLADQSIDVITRIYAPSKDEELLRLLQPDGLLIIVTPGQEHLLGLRQQIYTKVRPHQESQAPSGFSLVEQKQLLGDLRLAAGDETASLLAMTPFAWRLAPGELERIAKLELVDKTQFVINAYKRTNV
jgi:23S rRNA (guanine745-N1)-methyltransferase